MAENQKKDGFFKKIGNSAKATKSELKKVSWPTGKQLLNNTGIVIICIVVVGLVIFALDSAFGFGFKFLVDENATEAPTVNSAAGYEMTPEEESMYLEYLEELATAENATDASEAVAE
ncbi:MAG: preprotein translocase subunit SecE [Clostridia bacterium]|nr:preprotein translocase subunit SecE [Clostridia bacterium]